MASVHLLADRIEGGYLPVCLVHNLGTETSGFGNIIQPQSDTKSLQKLDPHICVHKHVCVGVTLQPTGLSISCYDNAACLILLTHSHLRERTFW